MKLVFLASTVPDLRWLKAYYVSVFPEGRARATNRFLAIQNLLKANPQIGHPVESVEGARAFHVSGTPFTFIYRIKQDRIEVLRTLDTRADWSEE